MSNMAMTNWYVFLNGCLLASRDEFPEVGDYTWHDPDLFPEIFLSDLENGDRLVLYSYDHGVIQVESGKYQLYLHCYLKVGNSWIDEGPGEFYVQASASVFVGN